MSVGPHTLFPLKKLTLGLGRQVIGKYEETCDIIVGLVSNGSYIC